MAELENPRVLHKVIGFLSSLLQRVAESNDPSQHRISIFDGLSRPSISIQSYLERIFKYANCSPGCLVVAYIYLDRFAQRRPLLPINSFNVHRLIITSVLLAAKFLDDIFSDAGELNFASTYQTMNHEKLSDLLYRHYNNAYYAQVGGISVEEMNFLELDFLFAVSFDLSITPRTFHNYCCYLQREMLLESLPLALKSQKLQCCFSDDESQSVPQKQQLTL